LKVHKIQRRKRFIHGTQQINTMPKTFLCSPKRILMTIKSHHCKSNNQKDQKYHQKQLQKKRSEASPKTTSEEKGC
jgi:hypothetical protein